VTPGGSSLQPVDFSLTHARAQGVWGSRVRQRWAQTLATFISDSLAAEKTSSSGHVELVAL